MIRQTLKDSSTFNENLSEASNTHMLPFHIKRKFKNINHFRQ